MTLNPNIKVRVVLKNGERRTVALWNPLTKQFDAEDDSWVIGQTVYRNLYDLVAAQNSRTQPEYNGYASLRLAVNPGVAGEQTVDMSDVVEVIRVELD